PARFPQFFEMVFVAQRVHRLPETVVFEGRNLIIARQVFHRLAFPDGFITRDIREYSRFEYEETAVNPAAVSGLFVERDDGFAFQPEQSETARRLRGGDGGELFLRAMKLDGRRNIHIAHAI